MIKRGLDKKLKGKVMLFDESIIGGRTMEAFHTALSELGSKPHLTSLFSSPGSEDILEKLPFSIHVAKKLNGRESYFGELGKLFRVSQQARNARRIKVVPGVSIPEELTRPKKEARPFAAELKRFVRARLR